MTETKKAPMSNPSKNGSRTEENRIREYRFGHVKTGSRTFTSDVIVWTGRIKERWWRKEGHRLRPEDLDEVIESRPARLVVGTGCYEAMEVPESTRRALEQSGIELTILPTGEAVECWNRWLEEGVESGIVAALHLTC